jgi:hypothetical protein
MVLDRTAAITRATPEDIIPIPMGPATIIPLRAIPAVPVTPVAMVEAAVTVVTVVVPIKGCIAAIVNRRLIPLP